MRLSRKPLITSLIAILLVAAFLAFRLTRTFSPFRYFAETNVTPFTSTFVWTSDTPTKGCLLLFELSKPSGLSVPQYLSNLVTFRFLCDKPTYNHHLTLPNLNPTRTHRVLLLSGLNLLTYKIDHRFIPDNLPALPNPPNGQAPAGSIITVQTPRGLLSTKTSDKGTWSLDLRDSFKDGTVLPVTLDYQNYHLQDYVIIIGNHQPTPDFDPTIQSNQESGITN